MARALQNRLPAPKSTKRHHRAWLALDRNGILRWKNYFFVEWVFSRIISTLFRSFQLSKSGKINPAGPEIKDNSCSLLLRIPGSFLFFLPSPKTRGVWSGKRRNFFHFEGFFSTLSLSWTPFLSYLRQILWSSMLTGIDSFYSLYCS